MLILKNFMVVSIHLCFGSLSVSGKRGKTAWIHSHCLKALAVLLCAVKPLKAEPFGLFTYADMGLEIMITGYQQDAVGSVEIPGEIIGKPVTSINTYAFRSCYGITKVKIPESVTSIGEGAFSHCYELRIVEIPGTVTAIPKELFYNCIKLDSVTIHPGVTSIGDYAFHNCGNLEAVEIPNSVTTLGVGAFNFCTRLFRVTIPSSVINTGEGSFSNCIGLTEVVISPGVSIVGKGSFLNCSTLKTVDIPDSVTRIESAAFAYCGSLASIAIPASVVRLGQISFRDCIGLKNMMFTGDAPTIEITPFVSMGRDFVVYYLQGASGFTSPTWQGYPAFIAAPYGGVIPNLAVNEAHLIGGTPADGDVKLEAPVTQAPLLWQRQTTPVTIDLETSRTLLLGSSGTVRVDAGDGALTIGKNPADGFLTAGGNANTPGTLVLDNASSNDITVNAVIANNGSGVVGLTKTGSGKAILTASNSFSGETSINVGTLVLRSACLADASPVRFTGGGTLQLDYPGTDVVGALYIGSTLQPNGLYDSTNTNGLITGSGKLQVGPFASYSAWTGVNAPGQTTDQDHDHDGVANGIEYFMGKTGNEFTANPGISPDGTVTWPKSPAFSGSYQVQTSADLVEWTDVTDDLAQVTASASSVVWTRPIALGNRFVRLVVLPD